MPEKQKTSFCELPRKAHAKIFGNLSQHEQQRNREVCSLFNNVISSEFPVELVISNSNFDRLFKCSNAKKVTIKSLTTEYQGEILFGGSLRTLVVTGRVVSSNLMRILSTSQKLESLIFVSPKQVLGLENNEVIGLSKLINLVIKVRLDQETFTSDELILINSLRNVKFGSLEKITISVKNFADWAEEDNETENSSQYFSLNQSRNNIEATNSMDSTHHSGVAPIYPSLEFDSNTVSANTGQIGTDVSDPSQNYFNGAALSEFEPSVTESEPGNSESNGVRATPVVADASAGMDSDTTSQGSTYSRIGVAEYEFASRLFSARLEMQVRNSDVDLDSYLSDPSSHGQQFRAEGPNPFVISAVEGLKTTAFFELMKNNADNLKTFIVKARPDFICFGNISPFPKDSKIQLEDVEYSFGRSRKLCMEFMLLEVQSKLHRLKIHILDDMWGSVMKAAEKSQATLTELDMKILSLSEDPIDLITLSGCNGLKVLKLFHFFEKESLHLLPTSLTQLVLNGPVTKKDLYTFTGRLNNLVDFTLILNYQPSEEIDIVLFKAFITMPKIKKLVFIQTQIDVKAVTEYCNQDPGVAVSVQGPVQLKEPYTLSSSIQYVVVSVNRDAQRNPTLTSSKTFKLRG